MGCDYYVYKCLKIYYIDNGKVICDDIELYKQPMYIFDYDSDIEQPTQDHNKSTVIFENGVWLSDFIMNKYKGKLQDKNVVRVDKYSYTVNR